MMMMMMIVMMCATRYWNDAHASDSAPGLYVVSGSLGSSMMMMMMMMMLMPVTMMMETTMMSGYGVKSEVGNGTFIDGTLPVVVCLVAL